MVTNETKYVVYFRNGKYYVCDEPDKHMLEKNEIYKDDLGFSEANKLAADLNFNLLIRK